MMDLVSSKPWKIVKGAQKLAELHKARVIEQWEVPIAAARLIEWIPSGEKEKLLSFVKAYFA